MHAMKPLAKDAQLSVQSHVEIVNLLAGEARGLAERRVSFFDRKPKGQHLLNALVLWYSRLGEGEKVAFGRDLMRLLEAFVREEPLPGAPAAVAAPGAGDRAAISVDPETGEPLPRPARKKGRTA